MPTYQANLESARDNLATILAEITADPKPSYSVEGKSISWNEYQSMILSQMANLEAMIQRAAGPFELRTRGRL